MQVSTETLVNMLCEIEAEDPNYRAGQVVEILCTQYLEISVYLQT